VAKNDGRTSSDFEDIIFVLNNRNTIWKEIQEADKPVKQYLKDEFIKLVAGNNIDEWIAAHLDYNDQQRGDYILDRLKVFASNQTN
jgi:hypothetical protein